MLNCGTKPDELTFEPALFVSFRGRKAFFRVELCHFKNLVNILLGKVKFPMLDKLVKHLTDVRIHSITNIEKKITIVLWKQRTTFPFSFIDLKGIFILKPFLHNYFSNLFLLDLLLKVVLHK